VRDHFARAKREEICNENNGNAGADLPVYPVTKNILTRANLKVHYRI
jgi:hypothetical protein